MAYQIKTPPCVYAGKGSIQKIKEIIKKERPERVLMFTDKGVVEAGLARAVWDLLEEETAEYLVVDHIKPEPAYGEIAGTIEKTEGFICDLILALGGGSVMDTAKLCSVLKGADYTIRDLMEHPEAARKQIPVIAVPTTCGTGAEATCNAIVAIPEKQVKKGIVNDEMIPDYVILDSDMTARLPPPVLAAAGMDALAHAVECFTSRKATPFSDLYAAEGANLIFHNIRAAYAEPENLEAKGQMLLGAYYGGVAITGSGTTAVHALSYPLGGRYHIPHGISNAILFPHVMRTNKSHCMKQLARLCELVWPDTVLIKESRKADTVIREIEEIAALTGIPASLHTYGVTHQDLEFLIQAGNGQKRLLGNNRKELSLKDIEEIYLKVLE